MDQQRPLAWIYTSDARFARCLRDLAGPSSYIFTTLPPGSLRRHCIISEPPSILLLDRDCPDNDVPTLLSFAVHNWPSVAIVVIATTNDEEDAACCLRAGADEWIALPVTASLFRARLSAVERRAARRLDACLARVGDLTVDRLHSRAYCSGSPLALTRKEYMLLDALTRAPNTVLTRASLIAYVWEEEGVTAPSANALEVYVGYLRRKIRHAHAAVIETVRGVGYMLVTSRESPSPTVARPSFPSGSGTAAP